MMGMKGGRYVCAPQAAHRNKTRARAKEMLLHGQETLTLFLAWPAAAKGKSRHCCCIFSRLHNMHTSYMRKTKTKTKVRNMR